MQSVMVALDLSSMHLAAARLCSIAAGFSFLYFQSKNGSTDFD